MPPHCCCINAMRKNQCHGNFYVKISFDTSLVYRCTSTTPPSITTVTSIDDYNGNKDILHLSILSLLQH